MSRGSRPSANVTGVLSEPGLFLVKLLIWREATQVKETGGPPRDPLVHVRALSRAGSLGDEGRPSAHVTRHGPQCASRPTRAMMSVFLWFHVQHLHPRRVISSTRLDLCDVHCRAVSTEVCLARKAGCSGIDAQRGWP